MRANITWYQAAIRVHRAFKWMMKDQEKRWPVFKAVRDRWNSFKLPTKLRVFLSLRGMTKQEKIDHAADEWFWEEFFAFVCPKGTESEEEFQKQKKILLTMYGFEEVDNRLITQGD